MAHSPFPADACLVLPNKIAKVGPNIHPYLCKFLPNCLLDNAAFDGQPNARPQEIFFLTTRDKNTGTDTYEVACTQETATLPRMSAVTAYLFCETQSVSGAKRAESWKIQKRRICLPQERKLFYGKSPSVSSRLVPSTSSSPKVPGAAAPPPTDMTDGLTSLPDSSASLSFAAWCSSCRICCSCIFI